MASAAAAIQRQFPVFVARAAQGSNRIDFIPSAG
jgi:hypothetical protein